MFYKLLIGGVGALALTLALAGPAPAANVAAGDLVDDNFSGCDTGEGSCYAKFGFQPKDELVFVSDENKNGWGVLLELWWDGKLQRWCWGQQCDFEIPEGQNIEFFITEFHKRDWDKCDESRGCGKRTHYWAGPRGRDGCNAIGDPFGDCAYGQGDFKGEA
jgi:hypothetical protein